MLIKRIAKGVWTIDGREYEAANRESAISEHINYLQSRLNHAEEATDTFRRELVELAAAVVFNRQDLRRVALKRYANLSSAAAILSAAQSRSEALRQSIAQELRDYKLMA